MLTLSHTVYSVVPILLALYSTLDIQEDKTKFINSRPGDISYETHRNVEYDFIVVGAGSAGCSLTYNLVSANFSVLLLEVGGGPFADITDVPGFYSEFVSNPEVFVQHSSIKQSDVYLSNDGISSAIEGRVLGGSSTINEMLYNRGSPAVYDYWANVTGDPSWRYDALVPFFEAIEDFQISQETNASPERRTGLMAINNISVHMSAAELKFQQIWNEAGKELGYEAYLNPNNPQSEGFATLFENKRKGRREGAFKVFVEPLLGSPNLHVSKYSEVREVDIVNGTALGVYYIKHGVLRYAHAKREVVISAGAFNTPVILLRSGIGPAAQLQESDVRIINKNPLQRKGDASPLFPLAKVLISQEIQVRANLPVGQGYQSHFGIGIVLNTTMLQRHDLTQDDIDSYIQNGTGPLALDSIATLTQAFLSTSSAEPNWPDLHLTVRREAGAFSDHPHLPTISFYLSRPLSTGTISLNTSDPQGPSLWNPNFLSVESDIDAIIEGANLAMRIAQSESMKSSGIYPVTIPIPACAKYEFGSGDYWRCHVRQIGRNRSHPSSTVRMGGLNDTAAVLDSKLRVKGIKQLRIADNSVMPGIVNSNTNAPALMIGQKAAAMIIQENSVKFKHDAL